MELHLTTRPTALHIRGVYKNALAVDKFTFDVDIRHLTLNVTCHTGSHNTVVPDTLYQTGRYLIYLPQRDGRLS